MAHRLTDCDEEKDLENDFPLTGLEKIPLQPFEETLSSPVLLTLLVLSSSELRALMSACGRKAKKLKKKQQLAPLNPDEAMAVNLYTQESNVYKKLNELLRQRSRQRLYPLFPYLKLLLTALFKLPPLKITVYRGVHRDLQHLYPKDEDIVWWGFSSTTMNLEVLENPDFLGTEGKRTMFAIKTKQALDIQRYSAMGFEQERLLLPGTCLVVEGVLHAGGGLTIVQLAEDDDNDEGLIPGFAFPQHEDGN